MAEKLVKDSQGLAKDLVNDCISRRAAIDATWFEPSYTDPLNVLTEVRDRLKALPPAQPETHDKRTESHACDLIDRRAAIIQLSHNKTGDDDCDVIVQKDIETIKLLPSAQPERKRGKWIYGEDEYGIDGYHCDKCGFFVPWDYAHKFINYIEDYNFCPGCGADMREVDDERPDL